MKTFVKSAAQGDCLLIRIKKLPIAIHTVKAQDGHFIVAHSETGHHHSLKERPEIRLYKSFDPFTGYLEIIGDEPAILEHHRSFDTHEALEIKPGIYEVRHQREYTPETIRRAAD